MQAKDSLRCELQKIVEQWGLPWPEKCIVESPKDPRHGDLSTNLALLVAKQLGKKPRELADELATLLQQKVPTIEQASAAGPGFCNVVFNAAFWHKVIGEVQSLGENYGKFQDGAGKKVLVEFVSANPTGPLHVGHGRGAAVGDSLARLLRCAGYTVDTEYYINDAGRQMRILGLSVWLRARELRKLPVDWPEDYYHGSYIIDLARDLLEREPGLLDLPEEEGIDHCYAYAMQTILDGIKADLAEFRVHQDNYFSEKSLVRDHAVDRAFAALDSAKRTYFKDNAYWFATTALGDDLDRVLRKSDGSLTYFASDIAYHHNKYERGYDWLIDVWGADHHGYIPRMRAAIESMGRSQESFDVILIQLVNLMKDGHPLGMSTRAGTFETLHDVLQEVGTDAARFMFLSRKSDSPLDFDLDLVRQRNLENPVYYVQYAHARISALLSRAKERGIIWADADLSPLTQSCDLSLLRKIASFEDTLRDAARTLGVHHVSRYLTELAGLVHSYYASQQILGSSDQALMRARLVLLSVIGQVLRNGLDVLGVEAPTQM
ncbi:MAG: arginine--tRNA ligase [Desulfovibrio sp.]|nr:arginine--tRNA ligase [Desulfovibrio sp.]